MNALNPCSCARGSIGSVLPSPSEPSIARRARLKRSDDGANATKCRPAAGVPATSEATELCANELSSVLKSARCTIAVPRGRTTPYASRVFACRRVTVCNVAL